MIEVENLRKRFKRINAVREVTFKARDAAITTLLGGNGSGKTTTLRMIAGVLRPDGGEVRIDGSIHVATERTRALSRLGVLHDEFGLYPRLTVREHVVFAAELNGLSGGRLAKAVNRAIDLLDLGDIQKRRTAGMSHGQRMKVALARAIVHEPPNLILDEPTRGLDIFAVRTLRAVLKELRARGVCILMSSHAMAEVAELSDSVIVMGDGKVLFQGPVPQVLQAANRPDLEDAFVALTEREASKGVAA